MQRKFCIAAVLMAVAIAGCTTSTTTETSLGLDIGEKDLGIRDSAGDLATVPDATYTQGERVYLMLSDIDGFETTEAGDYRPQANLTVTGPDGNTVVAADRILGQSAAQRIQSGTLPHLNAHWKTSMEDEPGQYELSIAVYDRAGGGTASASMTFQLEAAEGNTTDTGSDGQQQDAQFGVQQASLGVQNATGSIVVADDQTYQVGEGVFMILYGIGPLQQGEDDLYEFDSSIQLVADNGTVVRSRAMVFGERGHTSLQDASIGRISTGVGTTNLSAGSYTAEITLFDQVAGDQTTITRPVTLE